MLRSPVNECEIGFEFRNTTPLLVKDGRYNQGIAGKQMPAAVFQCRDDEDTMYDKVRMNRLAELKVFIAASTLRGVFRSHMECIARSFSPETPRVCNPFIEKEDARYDHTGATEVGCSFNGGKGYKDLCPICRIFGSTVHAGRISFEDANPVNKGSVRIAEQIAIDRFTGSVRTGLGPFKLMTLEGAKFECKIRLRNFELWQLGLLAYAFKDLKAGRLQIGMGRNLDRGHVRCDPTAAAAPDKLEMRLSYFGTSATKAGGMVKGLGALWGHETERYDLKPEDGDGIPDLLEPDESASDGVETVWRVRDSQTFWKALAPRWNSAVETFPVRRAPAAVGGN